MKSDASGDHGFGFCAAGLHVTGTWSDALAIGDGQNDVPMLREAGTSVAMANAKQSVRDAAQFGCASNADDGWVEAMERYVLS